MVIMPLEGDERAEFNGPVPAMITSFSVTPASANDFTFGLGIGFKVKLKFPYLKHEFGYSWDIAKATLTTGLKDWSENRRLRMDTAISDGTTATFDVGSHWPGEGLFSTYENIDGCQ